MLEREKQAINDKITDLTEDQKLLVDGIYEEYAVTLKETFQELRQSNLDRDARREKIISFYFQALYSSKWSNSSS